VIGFTDVGIVPHDVPRTRDEVLDETRVGRCPVGGDLNRSRPEPHHTSEQRPRRGGVTAFGDQDVDHLPVLVDSPVQLDPASGQPHIRVGSGRGAVSVFRLIGFLGPPAEPDVPVPEHPALHKFVPLGQAAVVVAVHGSGILVPR